VVGQLARLPLLPLQGFLAGLANVEESAVAVGPMVGREDVVLRQPIFLQPFQHALDALEQVGDRVVVAIDFVGHVVQAIPVFVIDDGSLDGDSAVEIFVHAPEVNLRLAPVLFFGYPRRFHFGEFRRRRRLEFQRPEAGVRFVLCLFRRDVEDAVAVAVNAIFLHLKEQFLAQAFPFQGAL
jgi:hypothetical protein